ncbi:MAG: glycosyltransferase family 9 protein [Bacteroidota bacterium]|jgi:ADP-heptose:LPS heptosyltransferase|nr:glycosyltransferase family 9 protein [Ignavibacteria bacterium]MCU7498442.1 glycosyltransferase family 9 protein [Ignavibacteria bacterium]MCU7513361.1 glycosyltransferase family 9 protein [Ignavibacteria bacterium]MCU7519983.1 glycosyltransferase family 9 protein [Ignavibacteria bacterium]MCU7523058.1 glycosyltransferase family 9 protein [Ignavibacteria bacterium]
MKIDKSKVKKILCIKLRGIGDVILSTVVLDNLKKEFPEAKIDYLTEAPSKAALEGLPFLNEVLILDRKKGLSAILDVRRKKYDLVLDFYTNPRTALITFLSGSRYRAGFPYKGRSYAYNLLGPAERDKFHAADLHLQFLKNLDLASELRELHFSLGNGDIEFADNFFKTNFKSNDFVVGLSPSGGWPSKKCDPVKFAEIGDEIARRLSAKILIIWGPGDKIEAFRTKELMKTEVVMAPPTDIRQMGSLMKKCRMLIANDSGPMHMATALKVPVLSLHGPTNPRLQGPYGERHEWIRLESLSCIGCNLLECPRHHECFLELPVENVMKKVMSIVEKNKLKLPVNEED